MISQVSGESTPQNIVHERTTPKRWAARFLASAVQGQTEHLDLGTYAPEMTELERKLVWEQIDKLEDRIYALLRV